MLDPDRGTATPVYRNNIVFAPRESTVPRRRELEKPLPREPVTPNCNCPAALLAAVASMTGSDKCASQYQPHRIGG
jgi:hypothetical protein